MDVPYVLFEVRTGL